MGQGVAEGTRGGRRDQGTADRTGLGVDSRIEQTGNDSEWQREERGEGRTMGMRGGGGGGGQ